MFSLSKFAQIRGDQHNFVKEVNVAQFSSDVSEHSAYHHGEQSLASNHYWHGCEQA